MQNFELLLKVLACACAHVPRQQEDTIRSEDPSLWYDIVFLGAEMVMPGAEEAKEPPKASFRRGVVASSCPVASQNGVDGAEGGGRKGGEE